MRNAVFSIFLILTIYAIFSSVSFAKDPEYNGEITFTFNPDNPPCGEVGAVLQDIEKITIKNLPTFEAYPAEEVSDRSLSVEQIRMLEDKWSSFNLRSDNRYSSNFNGHYLVVFGQTAQCTGCAFSEIIDVDSKKKFGRMEMYQGYLFTKFRKDSRLIIENFPPADVDACVFNEFPSITFYQVKNGELIKIKELKLSETEEFQRIKNRKR